MKSVTIPAVYAHPECTTPHGGRAPMCTHALSPPPQAYMAEWRRFEGVLMRRSGRWDDVSVELDCPGKKTRSSAKSCQPGLTADSPASGSRLAKGGSVRTRRQNQGIGDAMIREGTGGRRENGIDAS